MYTKDKSHRITLRLNDEQFEFVKSQSDVLDVSPSEFLRMVVNSTLAMVKLAYQQEQKKKLKDNEGEQGRENDEANFDDIIQQ